MIYGEQWQPETAQNLLTDWSRGEQLPLIKIVDLSQIDARGAYSQQTQTIYLSEALFHQETTYAPEIITIVLEELGHHLDAQLNSVDSLGDEGEAFAALVENRQLSSEQKAGKIWKVDETYVRVKGEWCYLYRGIDENGNLVDVRLSKTRDMDGTKAFFARAIENAENSPEQVQTDGLASYPRAIEEELGKEVKHTVLPCTANEIEQSHRGIKHRYYPMMGFGEFDGAQRFCQAFDEVRHFLRPRSRMGEIVSLSERRERFQNKVSELKEIFLATA